MLDDGLCSMLLPLALQIGEWKGGAKPRKFKSGSYGWAAQTGQKIVVNGINVNGKQENT